MWPFYSGKQKQRESCYATRQAAAEPRSPRTGNFYKHKLSWKIQTGRTLWLLPIFVFVIIFLLNLFSQCWWRVRNVAPRAGWQPVLGAVKLWEFGFGDSGILSMQLTRDFNYFSLGLHGAQSSPLWGQCWLWQQCWVTARLCPSHGWQGWAVHRDIPRCLCS